MSLHVVPIRPLGDPIARKISDLMDSIPSTTVHGEETRAELTQVRELLRQATETLKRTDARESSRYTEQLDAAILSQDE